MNNWKIFILACISCLVISFPKNIIGCGPGIDEYDYYTSFFNQHIGANINYQPFYYTGYRYLYNEQEPLPAEEVLAKEWAGFCGKNVNTKDAYEFVMQYSPNDLNNLYYHLEKNRPLQIPDSVKANSMTKYFMQKKDLETLGYILYAKKIEPYVTQSENYWDPIERDIPKFNSLIKGAKQLIAVAKNNTIKLKYGYQLTRLAHYSNQYADAVNYYDTYVAPNPTASVLQPMSLALKAGALCRLGNKIEAAYLFSKVFMQSDVKKISNYTSFFWAVDYEKGKQPYLNRCKNNTEKAAMLALFSLGNAGNEVETLSEIFKLDPANPVLEVLTTREINKLEETYLTPSLNKNKGGSQFYYSWIDVNVDLTKEKQHAEALKTLLYQMAKSGKSSNSGLFYTSAAYTAYLTQHYQQAHEYLLAAKKYFLNEKVLDQWNLTELLITINETEKINADFEARILPAVKWLYQKATAEYEKDLPYYEKGTWLIFYRNFMNEIMAKRYHAQKDYLKELLVIGAADYIVYHSNKSEYSNALSYLRNELSSEQVMNLYELMNQKNHTAFNNFLLTNNVLSIHQVVDFAGTAYLREYDYEKALTWFSKGSVADESERLATDPFIELLYDQEEALPNENPTYSKISFTKEMLRLKNLAEKDKKNAAASLYKMALGMYNMTYYGHAWQLVQYYRSGTDGYAIPEDATAFQKEYYGCFTAEAYFKKAMNASTDKNFKAKCLFMMAKCSQKQYRRPQYSDYPNYHYDSMQVDENKYFVQFKNNKYFPELLTYKNTAFFTEAETSCSYLRDFIKNNATTK